MRKQPSARHASLPLLVLLAALMLAILTAGCGPGGSSGSSSRSSSRAEKLKKENRELRREIERSEQRHADKLNSKNSSMVKLAMFLTAGCAVLFLVGTGMGSKARRDHDERHSGTDSAP